MLYNQITCRRLQPVSSHERHDPRDRFHKAAQALPFALFPVLYLLPPWNPIYAGIVAMAAGAAGPCCAVRTSSSTRRPAARTTGAAYGFCAGRPAATVCGVFRAGITARPWSNDCFIRGRILASSHDGAMSRAIISIARARGAAVAELSSTLLHDEYVDEPEAAIMTEIIYLSYRRFQDLSCAMFS